VQKPAAGGKYYAWKLAWNLLCLYGVSHAAIIMPSRCVYQTTSPAYRRLRGKLMKITVLTYVEEEDDTTSYDVVVDQVAGP
jgi:hypothetical protein